MCQCAIYRWHGKWCNHTIQQCSCSWIRCVSGFWSILPDYYNINIPQMLLVLLEQPWPTRGSRGQLRFPKDWSSFTTITCSRGIGWVDYSVAWNAAGILSTFYALHTLLCCPMPLYTLQSGITLSAGSPMPILSPLTFIHYWSLTHRQYHFSGPSDSAARHPRHAHVFGPWVVETSAGPHTQQCMNKFVSSDRLCSLSNAPFHGHVATWRGCWLGRSLVTFTHLTQDYMECICRYSISACSNILYLTSWYVPIMESAAHPMHYPIFM